jgi:predicted translin family RNA/ssDNA-binding protein
MKKSSRQLIKLLQKAVKNHRAYEDTLPRAKQMAQSIRVGAKRAIVAARKGNASEYEVCIKSVTKDLKSLENLSRGTKSRVVNEGFVREALEEYIEALLFNAIVTDTALELPDVAVENPEILISGLSDAVGEILRLVILNAGTTSIMADTEKYRALVETLLLELASVAHGGKLRQKYDEMERNLRKLEHIIYEMNFRGDSDS